MSTVRICSIDQATSKKIGEKLSDMTIIYLARCKIHVGLQKPSKWVEYREGYLVLCDSNVSPNPFIIQLDPENLNIIFSHELYFDFGKHFQQLATNLYCFPSDSHIIAFQFLLDAEAQVMYQEILKISPKKPSLFSNFFKPKKADNVISVPMHTQHTVGMQWDPEQGYLQTFGDIQNLPAAHQQYLEKLSSEENQ